MNRRPPQSLEGSFFVRSGTVSPSRPAKLHRASRAAAVKTGRRPPPKAARSGLDGGEHGAMLTRVGRTSTPPPLTQLLGPREDPRPEIASSPPAPRNDIARSGASLAAAPVAVPVCPNASAKFLFPSSLRARRPAPPRYRMDPRTDRRSRQPLCARLAQPEPGDRTRWRRAARGGAPVCQHFRDFWRERGAARPPRRGVPR